MLDSDPNDTTNTYLIAAFDQMSQNNGLHSIALKLLCDKNKCVKQYTAMAKKDIQLQSY